MKIILLTSVSKIDKMVSVMNPNLGDEKINYEFTYEFWRVVAYALASVECSLILDLIKNLETIGFSFWGLLKHAIGLVFWYWAYCILKGIHDAEMILKINKRN